ncbi:HNH endonuclease signature motif containing protein [Methylobacterium bullatum]|uniref:HNH endonuclease signature motif containing protein n=1 Tax=Methylobacterium bullatum TaxID=570505 RepID=UPI0037C7253D
MRTAVRRYTYRKVQKGHNITAVEIEEILRLYDVYEGNCGAACDALKGENLPALLLDAIQAAFEKTQEGRQLYSLRELLFNGVSHCPVCGIDPPTELDHQLPQSIFKPLSIHARNLVPLCHSCNHTKLAGFGVGGRAFLHVYYDKLPDLDFLQANIAVNGNTLVATYSIDAAAALPPGFTDRLTGQMETLKLNQRYQQEVNTYISSHAAALHLTYGAIGQEGVVDLLRLQTRYETQAFHRNHWRPALLRALVQHNDFTSGGFAHVLPIPADMLLDLSK